MIWSREAGNPFHGSFFVWKFWTLWKQKNHIMETITKYVLAPLAGYTDLPFRRMCWKRGMDQAYTALIDAGALIFGNPENSHILARGDDEPWVGVQLMGSRLDLLEKAPVDAENPYELLADHIRSNGLKYETLLYLADKYYNRKTILQLAHTAGRKEELF